MDTYRNEFTKYETRTTARVVDGLQASNVARLIQMGTTTTQSSNGRFRYAVG